MVFARARSIQHDRNEAVPMRLLQTIHQFCQFTFHLAYARGSAHQSYSYQSLEAPPPPESPPPNPPNPPPESYPPNPPPEPAPHPPRPPRPIILPRINPGRNPPPPPPRRTSSRMTIPMTTSGQGIDSLGRAWIRRGSPVSSVTPFACAMRPPIVAAAARSASP